MAKCKTCGAPVNLAPDGDPKYDPPRIPRRPSPSGDADLVERLRLHVRSYEITGNGGTKIVAAMREAAAALEASAPLRAELEEALVQIEAAKAFGVGFYGANVEEATREHYRNEVRRARAAPTSPNKGEDDA